jgi:hypothetical protein
MHKSGTFCLQSGLHRTKLKKEVGLNDLPKFVTKLLDASSADEEGGKQRAMRGV